ncbi:hypothetical protein MRX96_011630 [Rhipicephalus microplus]
MLLEEPVRRGTITPPSGSCLSYIPRHNLQLAGRLRVHAFCDSVDQVGESRLVLNQTGLTPITIPSCASSGYFDQRAADADRGAEKLDAPCAQQFASIGRGSAFRCDCARI